ncbi:MAG: hypothetical protein SVC26_04025 [Pseudomonadota bacterium]|nr:hypothetical protein [Pseudomonadota bacterium]
MAFLPRLTRPILHYQDAHGIKLYSIQANQDAGQTLEPYFAQLERMKAKRALDCSATASFAIFHDGAERQYLILCWWLNGNELFQSVAVNVQEQWVQDNEQFSFCVHDLAVMWAERNAFIQCFLDQPAHADLSKKLAAYRALVFHPEKII